MNPFILENADPDRKHWLMWNGTRGEADLLEEDGIGLVDVEKEQPSLSWLGAGGGGTAASGTPAMPEMPLRVLAVYHVIIVASWRNFDL